MFWIAFVISFLGGLTCLGAQDLVMPRRTMDRVNELQPQRVLGGVCEGQLAVSGRISAAAVGGSVGLQRFLPTPNQLW